MPLMILSLVMNRIETAPMPYCLGVRLAEMQLKILWEELLKRHPVIECRGKPKRLWSNFINGIKTMPVYIPA